MKKTTSKAKPRSTAALTRAAQSVRADLLRQTLGIDRKTWRILLQEGPLDAHMEPVEWCRLMILCAGGFGGVMEHTELAVQASGKAEDIGADGGKPVLRQRKGKAPF